MKTLKSMINDRVGQDEISFSLHNQKKYFLISCIDNINTNNFQINKICIKLTTLS